jgi:hypothetical protein
MGVGGGFTQKKSKEQNSCKEGKQRKIPLKLCKKIPAQADSQKFVHAEQSPPSLF